ETGKYHRSKRPIEVEAVFGQMKSNNRVNRFSMRGLEKVNIEFALMCIGHNLRKWSKKLLKTTSFRSNQGHRCNNPLSYDMSSLTDYYHPMAASGNLLQASENTDAFNTKHGVLSGHLLIMMISNLYNNAKLISTPHVPMPIIFR